MRTTRPRRKPRLKVVGREPTQERHVVPYQWDKLQLHQNLIVELWTEAEYAALAPWEREAIGASVVPGIGYLALTTNANDDAIRDAIDLWRQAHDRHDFTQSIG